MAAFANNRGGFLVFGVEPSPHRLCGVGQRFAALDPVKLTAYLSSHLSPEVNWEPGSLEFQGFSLGYLYTHETTAKPVMVTASDSSHLREGDIYYRYNAQSASIRYPEFRQIVDDLLLRERQAWLQHLSAIVRSGPTNVAILDTLQGRILGGGSPYLIDEALLRKLKFVREGDFVDKGGSPALRLVGDLQPISGAVITVPVTSGIHEDDLVSAFLAQRQLSDMEAQAYLREAAHQVTPYVPVNYYLHQSSLSLEEAIELLRAENVTFKATRNKLVKRLKREIRHKPMGTIRDIGDTETAKTPAELSARLVEIRNIPDRRTLLAATLSRTPEVVASALADVDLLRMLEAVTNVPARDVKAKFDGIRTLLLSIFRDSFSTMDQPKRLAFRKSVTYLDEVIFGEDG